MPVEIRVTPKETAIPTAVLRLALWSIGFLLVAAGAPSFTHAAQPATVSANPSSSQRVPDPKAYYHFLRG
ncbi:MAG: hypothetical protein AABY69_05910, partial [Nitrospirota bacterium]